ncbi:hypothetical protein J4G37_04865 [Microvirga sp. 3-52]|nr:hypothetical protein [Microvirga sp. 3-52]
MLQPGTDGIGKRAFRQAFDGRLGLRQPLARIVRREVRACNDGSGHRDRDHYADPCP